VVNYSLLLGKSYWTKYENAEVEVTQDRYNNKTEKDAQHSRWKKFNIF